MYYEDNWKWLLMGRGKKVALHLTFTEPIVMAETQSVPISLIQCIHSIYTIFACRFSYFPLSIMAAASIIQFQK